MNEPTYEELKDFLDAYLADDTPNCKCPLCIRARALQARFERNKPDERSTKAE